MRILSPIVRGSGAVVVHKMLETALPGYRVCTYSPKLEYMPILMRGLCKGAADLIHTGPDYGVFFARHQLPLVVTFHNYVLDPFMRAYSTPLQNLHYATDLRLFTRLALRRAQAITAVSHFTADLVRNDLGFAGKITVIPNGIDTMRFFPARSKRSDRVVRVLFSGNPTRRKGGHWLQKIAAHLDRNVRLIITGGLRGGQDLKEAGGRLEWMTSVPHESMPELYRNVDILLLPTVREGMSLAVLEAMASGLSVVATDCSSMPELIIDGKGGFLCRLGDVVDFAKRINQLADSVLLRRDMKEFNRSRVEQYFTAQKMVSSYCDFFDNSFEK